MNKRITLTLVLIMNLAWVLAQTSGTFGGSPDKLGGLCI